LDGSTAAKPGLVGQNGFRKSQLIRSDSERGEPYMFFNQLDERNAMVQSNLALEELAQTGLPCLGTGLPGS
jgi:hypothetical protein